MDADAALNVVQVPEKRGCNACVLCSRPGCNPEVVSRHTVRHTGSPGVVCGPA